MDVRTDTAETPEPPGKSDLLADIVGGGGAQFGNLLEVENSEVVELFLDSRRYGGKLFKIIGDAARSR